MATTAVTCALLTLNTLSAKLDPVNGGGSGNAIVATTPSDGWVISPPAGQTLADARLFLTLFYNATESITIKAGTRYPAQRTDLGDLALAGTSADVKYVCIETSRFLQTDGTIKVTGINASNTLTAVMLPKAQ